MNESLTGKFLVASKHLRDPNFYKTVVLIIEHDEHAGTTGLVLNKPSPIRISQAIVDFVDFPEIEDCLYMGGPVEPTALFLLHNLVEFQEQENNILPGVYLGDNADVFEQVINSISPEEDHHWIRIFSGYAGWAPTQLEQEILRGDWMVCPAEESNLQHADPYDFWEQTSRIATKYQRLLPMIKGTPEWN